METVLGRPKPLFVRRLGAFLDHASGPEILFALLIIGAPLAIGSVHLGPRIILASMAIAAFVWCTGRLARQGRRVRVGIFGTLGALALLWAFIQWVPLPAGLVELLAPASAAARDAAAAAAGVDPPSFYPMTLDGGATASGIVTLLALLATFFVGLNLRTDPAVPQRVVVYVELAGLVTLALGVLHKVLGLTAIYGFYASSTSLSDRLLVTPFVNPNHAAALMLMGAVVGFGIWLAEAREKRWHLVASILLSMGVLATMSRANTVLLLVALLALGAWVFAARDAALRSRYLRLIVGVVCCAVVTVVLMGPGEWLKELATLAELESPQTALVASCWEVGVDLASLQWLSGVGSGAFEAAAPSVMDGWRLGLVAYAHNGVLQVLAEMGLVVGGILLLGFFLGFLRLAYQTRKAVAIGATVVAVGVVAVQNFVDFSLWLPGVGVPAAALLGLAVATTWPPPTTRKRRFGTVRWPWAATIVVVGTLCVTSLHAWNERPAAWRGEILGHLADGKPGAIDVPSILAAHPHDFYAFRLAAVVARGQEEDTRALAYLKRAHALAPQESDTMAALAAAHLRLGEAESAEQLLTALAASDLGSERRALTVLLDAEKGPRNATDQAVLNRLLAKRPEWVLSAAAVLAEKGDNAAAESLLFWATNTFPESLEIYETLGSRWATRREKRSILDTLSTGLLARAGNLENLDERAPLERTAYLLQGHVMSLDGKPLEAWHLYTTAAELDPIHAAPPLIAAGLVAVTLRRDELLDQVLEGLTKHEIRGRWPSGRLNLLKSHQAEWRGDLDTAAQSMETALRHLKRHGPYLKRLEALYLRLDASAAAARIRGIIDGEVEAEEGTK